MGSAETSRRLRLHFVVRVALRHERRREVGKFYTPCFGKCQEFPSFAHCVCHDILTPFCQGFIMLHRSILKSSLKWKQFHLLDVFLPEYKNSVINHMDNGYRKRDNEKSKKCYIVTQFIKTFIATNQKG